MTDVPKPSFTANATATCGCTATCPRCTPSPDDWQVIEARALANALHETRPAVTSRGIVQIEAPKVGLLDNRKARRRADALARRER